MVQPTYPAIAGTEDRQADGAGPSGQEHDSWEEGLLGTLAPAEALAKAARPRYPPQQLQFLQMLAAKDPAILASFGATPQVGRSHGLCCADCHVALL